MTTLQFENVFVRSRASSSRINSKWAFEKLIKPVIPVFCNSSSSSFISSFIRPHWTPTEIKVLPLQLLLFLTAIRFLNCWSLHEDWKPRASSRTEIVWQFRKLIEEESKSETDGDSRSVRREASKRESAPRSHHQARPRHRPLPPLSLSLKPYRGLCILAVWYYVYELIFIRIYVCVLNFAKQGNPEWKVTSVLHDATAVVRTSEFLIFNFYFELRGGVNFFTSDEFCVASFMRVPYWYTFGGMSYLVSEFLSCFIRC